MLKRGFKEGMRTAIHVGRLQPHCVGLGLNACVFYRHHPDLDESPDAHIRFMAAQRAYEILIGRGRGKEDKEGVWSEGGGWDFHDWCDPDY